MGGAGLPGARQVSSPRNPPQLWLRLHPLHSGRGSFCLVLEGRVWGLSRDWGSELGYGGPRCTRRRPRPPPPQVAGVICVQGLLDRLLEGRFFGWSYTGGTSTPTSRPAQLHARGAGHAGGHTGGYHKHGLIDGRMLTDSAAAADGAWVLGMGAMLTAALCTSFASVYFERMLKGERQPSLWLRNIQARPHLRPIRPLFAPPPPAHAPPSRPTAHPPV